MSAQITADAAMTDEITRVVRAAKDASRVMRTASTEQKNRALKGMAEGLAAATSDILAANVKDVEAGKAKGLSSALVDRLAANLDENGVAQPGLVDDVLGLVRALADGVRQARCGG